ncbi:hypothetical protein C2G38_1960200, partial [Gigaspora rosea]
YPLISIIETDISQQQPKPIKPNNFTFIKATVLKRIPFNCNTFDYIFQHHLFGAYTNRIGPQTLNALVRVLKPGGLIEVYQL